MGDELLVAKLVEREVVACIADAVKVFDVGDDSCVDLHVYLFCPGLGLDTFLILVFECKSLDAASGDYLGAEVEVDAGYEGGAEHLGEQDSAETDSSGEHGDNLATVGELDGKAYDGDEYEEG